MASIKSKGKDDGCTPTCLRLTPPRMTKAEWLRRSQTAITVRRSDLEQLAQLVSIDRSVLRIALALQLGGAVGNLIDRALYGHVTDFLKIPNWPVFNVADSAIAVGVATVVIFLIFGDDGEAKQPAPAP